jgi:hypothetical protein
LRRVDRSRACVAASPSAPTSGSTARRKRARHGRRRVDADAQCLAVPHEQAGTTLRGVARPRAATMAARWSMPTWSAGRTNWCSTAHLSRSTARERLTHQLPAFVEAILAGGRLRGRQACCPATIAEPQRGRGRGLCGPEAGRADYLGKNGFPGAIIGLSGGIDSALTLAIAVDALGADQVRAVMMPSPWTAQMSLDDSREMVAASACNTTKSHRRRDGPVRRIAGADFARRPGPEAGLGYHGRKPAGAHSRHAADGAVQPYRAHRADHRQQERDGGGLRHALRRHGRRLSP